jgi:hypothetical protein
VVTSAHSGVEMGRPAWPPLCALSPRQWRIWHGPRAAKRTPERLNLFNAVARMIADDLKRIAVRYTELINPGQSPDMTDAQKAVWLLHLGKALHAALLHYK